MKIVLHLLAIIALALPAYSCIGNPSSSLIITQEAGAPLSVRIDDRIYRGPYQEFRLDDVLSGYRFIKVKAHFTSFDIYGRPNAKIQTIFKGRIFIKPGMEIFAMIDRNNRFIIQSEYPLYTYEDPYYPPEAASCQSGCTCQHCAIPEYIPCHPGCDRDHCRFELQAMHYEDFDLYLREIRREHFDSYRMPMIERLIRINYLNTDQVVRLMELLTFESNRLEVAKMAFHKTLDNGRYFLVNRGFKFISSKRELEEYVSQFD